MLCVWLHALHANAILDAVQGSAMPDAAFLDAVQGSALPPQAAKERMGPPQSMSDMVNVQGSALPPQAAKEKDGAASIDV